MKNIYFKDNLDLIANYLKESISFRSHLDTIDLKFIDNSGNIIKRIKAIKLLSEDERNLEVLQLLNCISQRTNTSKDLPFILNLKFNYSQDGDTEKIVKADINSSIIESDEKFYYNYSKTLFNPAPGTNFIYKVIFPDNVKIDCDGFNKETYNGKPGKISYRLKKIKELGGEIIFDSVQSQCLWQNLRTIDTGLPVILANALLIKYLYNLSKWEDIIKKLNELNPMDFRITKDSPVYEYKIKRFLQDAAMGMNPESEWDGFYDANGGQIIVKKNGDIVCYHIYELNRYLKYLFDSTKLDQPATSEDENNPGHVEPSPSKQYQFGWLYEQNGEYFIKINLQVRFK